MVAPDGSWLATGGEDRTVRIWDVTAGLENWDIATAQERAILAGHADPVAALTVAPDGSWLAAGGEDGTVRILDVATGQERAIFTGHTGFVEEVAVAPDGSWPVSATQDGMVRIWEAATGKEQATPVGLHGAMQLGDLLLQRHPLNEPLGPLTRCQGRVLPSDAVSDKAISPRVEPGQRGEPPDSLGECE